MPVSVGDAGALEADPDRGSILYSISAHPDDEFAVWGAFEDRPESYVVSVLMTQGEQTDSCKTAAESPPIGDPELENGTITEGFSEGEMIGPYKYQGPGSPVGEPDKGERRPLGNPWRRQGSRACKRARVASWHWFLDDMAALDSGLTDMRVRRNPWRDDDYEGRFCGGPAGCADVWANGAGARVAFDLGDRGFPFDLNPDPLTADKVTTAFQALRAYRKRWGLPRLPEGEILAAVPNPIEGSQCPSDPHPDHQVVAEALYELRQGGAPQLGVACPSDERYQESPGPDHPIDPDILPQANLVDPVTEQRMGPWVVNYGWLFGTYTFAGGVLPDYWERYAEAPPPQIELSVKPLTAAAGERERYRFAATMTGTADPVPLPRVRIEFAGERRRTNGFGRATITKRLGAEGVHRVRAERRGLQPATVQVEVAGSPGP
ncbi:MAG: hypothetical protein ACR2G3_12830 [Solirubrobacterales bacterium]